MSELDLFCTNCFASIEGNTTGFCQNCGKSLDTFYTPDYQLPVNSSLNNGRYSVSEVQNVGDFDISYIGYDFQLQTQVVIKEVFYRGVSQRDSSDGSTTSVSYAYDFPIDELCRKIQRDCLSISGGRGLSNIVKINDWFLENNTAYYVTEYIEGSTLEDWVASNGRLNWGEAYRKLKPIMTSLSTLHSKGIFHRNIIPKNIIVRNSDFEFVLTDFGLSRTVDPRYLTGAVESFATGFLPYEQRVFLTEDGAYTDIYSINACLYYCVTGEYPAEEMYDKVQGNFPKIDMLQSHYGVSERAVEGLKLALDPQVNTRCRDINEIMRYYNETDNRQPHYLYGKRMTSESSEYVIEARKRMQGKSREQIKSEYYERIVEKQKEDDRQQREITYTVGKLLPKYARRVASYDRSLITMKGLIIPAVFVAIIIFLIVMGRAA